MPAVIKLPYMGQHKEPTKHFAPPMRSIPFTDLHDHEIERNFCADELHEHRDPLDVLINKVEHLSQLLGCTEAKAERILLQRLGSKV